MRGEEGVARFIRLAPEQNSLLDVWTLRGICVPWIATNGYRLVRGVRILMGLRNSGGVQVVVILNLDLSVMVVNGRKSVVVLLAARRSRDNR